MLKLKFQKNRSIFINNNKFICRTKKITNI